MSYNEVVQAIADMQTDAQTLEDVISGEPNTQARSRLGRLIYTLSTINHRVDIATNKANQKLTDLENAINTAAAAGAGKNGWTDLLIASSENVNQRQINDGLESIAQLAGIKNPRNGQRVYVKSYHAGYNRGGGWFVFDSSKININDGGVVINGWVRQADDVKVEYFGAKGDHTTDDYHAINKAAQYAAKNNKELKFSDAVYLCLSEIIIDGADTIFKAVRWVGTFKGTGTSAEYSYWTGTQGTVILTKGNNLLTTKFKRLVNENIVIDGIAFVDETNKYPNNTAKYAIKISKGDLATYPDNMRYITGLQFNNVAFVGYVQAIIFSGNYTKSQGAYTANYIGPTSFSNLYVYKCNDGIVAENATLNRLSIDKSLFFNINHGAIVKREALDIAANERTESLIMCQINMTHFEGCWGIFRFSGQPPANEFKNQITMIDVTREFCGLYDGQNGSPYGVVEYTDIRINGRHDQYGENAVANIGIGSTLTSDTLIKARILPEGGKSLSPSKINVDSKTVTVDPNASKIVAVNGFDIDKPFDITVKVIINGGTHGYKELKAFGVLTAGSYRVLTETGELHSTVTIQKLSYNTTMLEIIVTNTAAVSIIASVEVTNNTTGMQLSVV